MLEALKECSTYAGKSLRQPSELEHGFFSFIHTGEIHNYTSLLLYSPTRGVIRRVIIVSLRLYRYSCCLGSLLPMAFVDCGLGCFPYLNRLRQCTVCNACGVFCIRFCFKAVCDTSLYMARIQISSINIDQQSSHLTFQAAFLVCSSSVLILVANFVQPELLLFVVSCLLLLNLVQLASGSSWLCSYYPSKL